MKRSDAEEMQEMKVKATMTQFPYQILIWQRSREEMVWESSTGMACPSQDGESKVSRGQPLQEQEFLKAKQGHC